MILSVSLSTSSVSANTLMIKWYPVNGSVHVCHLTAFLNYQQVVHQFPRLWTSPLASAQGSSLSIVPPSNPPLLILTWFLGTQIITREQEATLKCILYLLKCVKYKCRIKETCINYRTVLRQRRKKNPFTSTTSTSFLLLAKEEWRNRAETFRISCPFSSTKKIKNMDFKRGIVVMWRGWVKLAPREKCKGMRGGESGCCLTTLPHC